MRRNRFKNSSPNVELQMTSMIDIVFLLLVFFVMTFQVVIPEGDFALRMAAATPGSQSLEQPPEKIRVRLRAGVDGSLSGIEAEGKTLASLVDLRQLVLSLTGSNSGPVGATAPEIEFDADPGLDYQHLMAALTAVKGYRTARGEVIHVIERITLMPNLSGRT